MQNKIFNPIVNVGKLLIAFTSKLIYRYEAGEIFPNIDCNRNSDFNYLLGIINAQNYKPGNFY